MRTGNRQLTDEVDTGQLLQGLHGTSSRQTLSKSAAKDLGEGRLTKAELILMVGLDLRQLLNQSGMVNIKAAESGERLRCGLHLTALDQVAGRFWEDKHSNDKDDGPGKLDRNRDPVGAGIIAILGGIVDDGSQEQANRDRQLIAADDGTSDPFGRGL